MEGVQLRPVDTLFFRDGTPFSSASASQDDVGGQFPPYPATVVGALRAALARAKGWSGKSRERWSPALNQVLGDGDDLGLLRFEGPFLLHAGEPLYPVPRHLLGVGRGAHWRPRALLLPGAPVTCDLGSDVRLPKVVMPAGEMREAQTKIDPRDLVHTTAWLTAAGLATVLAGRLPAKEQLVAIEALWRHEHRIGLQRDNTRRAAVPGMLYSTRHTRFHSGVAIGMRIGGLPEDWSLPMGRTLPLGGERRMAACSAWRSGFRLEVTAPKRNAAAPLRFTAIALTPLALDEAIWRGEAPIAELGGARVVCACLARQARIGGWSSIDSSPRLLRSVLPAASVLFCELSVDAAGKADAVQAALKAPCPILSIGNRTRWGFGVVALGCW